MINVIVTNHAALRMMERTPFEEANFARIASYAYAKATRASGEKDRLISAYLDTIAKENAGRYNKAGRWVAKLHSGFIYLFNIDDAETVRLITVVKYEEQKAIAYMKRLMFK